MESKPATIREIAKAAGVSPSTVFRVLNSGTSVSPNTRAKVIAAQQILQNKKAVAPAKESSRFSVGKNNTRSGTFPPIPRRIWQGTLRCSPSSPAS